MPSSSTGARLLLFQYQDSADAQGRVVWSVRSVVTHDAGLTRFPRLEPGVFRARAKLLAEGMHGSLSQSTIFTTCARTPRRRRTGWGCRRCSACHRIRTPPAGRSGGRMKHDPHLRALLAVHGAERLAYGARTLTEGGIQTSRSWTSRQHVDGTGMLAAEAAFAALHSGAPFVCTASPATLKHPASAAASLPPPLKQRTSPSAPTPPPSPAHPRTRASGPCATLRHAPRACGGRALRQEHTMLRGRTNTSTTSPDGLATAACPPIAYPTFEPPLSTDLMSSVALTGTNPAANEAVHLRVGDENGRDEKEKEKGGVDAQETAARRPAHVAEDFCFHPSLGTIHSNFTLTSWLESGLRCIVIPFDCEVSPLRFPKVMLPLT
ncbi:hypothetical protein DFH09DRAFT_1316468 [Mycena vulgaris]|nr:hypothetical protein DFH09DRAFT_1316468 [Mycena vulgaris]